MERNKIIITIFLILIILSAIIFLILNKDTAFSNKIEIDYPDGCIEIYINSILQSEKCDYKEELYDSDILILNYTIT